MSEEQLKIVLTHPEAKQPTRAHVGDAGLDLYSVEDRVIPAYEGKQEAFDISRTPSDPMCEVRTGVHVEIPSNYFGRIACRSSYGKKGLRVHFGTIDSSYRGELTVLIQNLGNTDYIIHKGDRIAQLLIIPYKHLDVKVVETLSETARGEKCYGSSGK